MLLYSDGFVEAHGPDGSMFGFPRLRDAFAAGRSGNELVDDLVEGLWRFTGRDWDQEDDLTIVTLRRVASAGRAELADDPQEAAAETDERTLATFSIPGEIGTERDVAERVAAAVASLDIPPASLERLKTAVSEAAMNAIEYGSAGRPDIPVAVAVSATDLEVLVRITDRALSGPISDAEEPDIEAKLAAAAEAARMGPLPDPPHGGPHGRDTARGRADGDARAHPRGGTGMSVERLTAHVEPAPDGARIVLAGDLNGSADAVLAGAYRQAVAAIGTDGGEIVLDFRSTGYINSTGIALVVRLLAEARRDGRTVQAVGLTEHYQEIFRITRLSDFMEIVEGDAA